LVPLVTDSSAPLALRVKAAEAAAVAAPGSERVAAALAKLAADPDPTLRAAALGAMAKLDPFPPLAIIPLVKAVKEDSRNEGRVAALGAMVVLGPKADGVKGDVSAIAGGANPWYALWAKVALVAMDGDATKAAPAVRAGLTDKNGIVRATAAEALLLVGGP